MFAFQMNIDIINYYILINISAIFISLNIPNNNGNNEQIFLTIQHDWFTALRCQK